MNAVATHLDDLLMVLKASADLPPDRQSASHLRLQLAQRLEAVRPSLAARVRAMDDWHAEVLADFIADADVVAEALDYVPMTSEKDDDTRVGWHAA
jgi:hypothetical protein